MTRVVVIDDHRSYAQAVCTSLEQQPAVDECRWAGSIEEALEVTEGWPYDVAMVDVLLPGGPGIDGLGRLRAHNPGVRTVVVTGNAEVETLAQAALAGADAFVTKDQPIDDVIAAVLGDGDVMGDADLLARVTEDMRRREMERIVPPPVHLTPRERQILALLSEGTLLGDIAKVLGIRVETCRGYVKSLLAKLGARSQLQAVVTAARMGLLPADHPLGENASPGEASG